MKKFKDIEFEMPGTATAENEFSALCESPIVCNEKQKKCTSTDMNQSQVVHFAGFGLDEQPLVKLAINGIQEFVPARTAVPLLRDQIGRSVVIVCEAGDPYRPIILGVIQNNTHSSSANRLKEPALPLAVQMDDERCIISAEREIVLRCGDASITLTRAGKVIIKGNYILSRSTGYNKIKGAAIDIN